ncbi:transposase DNA-binding-containing protein [Bradyrhizobium sp. WU425]|uniref:transposase DNA-binding-containing protein n=1 Tax=Bradyrhizobium sp. WU425 TaxID=187029 RepID=UPI00404A08B5
MGLTLRDRSAKGRLRLVGGECWIDRETSGCQSRDARLGDRFRCSRRLEAPSDKVFRSSANWANTKAAYRFFSNDRVSEADILAGHFQSARERTIAAGGPVLVLDDTTQFSYQR